LNLERYADVEITLRNTYLLTLKDKLGNQWSNVIKNKRYNSRFGFDEMVKMGKGKP